MEVPEHKFLSLSGAWQDILLDEPSQDWRPLSVEGSAVFSALAVDFLLFSYLWRNIADLNDELS